VATAWDDPATGEVIVLNINEALYFGDHRSYRYFLNAPGDEWHDLLSADAEAGREGD
jgi:hypothetical protein